VPDVSDGDLARLEILVRRVPPQLTEKGNEEALSVALGLERDQLALGCVLVVVQLEQRAQDTEVVRLGARRVVGQVGLRLVGRASLLPECGSGGRGKARVMQFAVANW